MNHRQLDDLFAMYLSKNVINDDRILLLSTNDAIDFIQAGLSMGLHLDGVEGFRIVPPGPGIQPVQDYSNDIADVQMSQQDFVASTLALIREGATNNIVFEVWMSK